MFSGIGVAFANGTNVTKDEGIGETGTDPRDFAAKFMPYYRYTELKNGLEQQEVVLFGLVPLSKKFAMTYEIPLAYHRDITETSAYKNKISKISGGDVTIPGGLPFDAEGDGRETGIGDMNLRFFYRTDWKLLDSDWLIGSEFVFPTANEDVLGNETFLIKPMLTLVKDISFWPAPGAFFAMMNFYSFDAWKDSSRESVSQYIGRYFFMLPLHPSGIYALPEIQFIYDFKNDKESLWIGPEIGKLLAPGRILYAKPGFGIDPDPADREFTFEAGFRWFF
jgi:hypothetical protein